MIWVLALVAQPNAIIQRFKTILSFPNNNIFSLKRQHMCSVQKQGSVREITIKCQTSTRNRRRKIQIVKVWVRVSGCSNNCLLWSNNRLKWFKVRAPLKVPKETHLSLLKLKKRKVSKRMSLCSCPNIVLIQKIYQIKVVDRCYKNQRMFLKGVKRREKKEIGTFRFKQSILPKLLQIYSFKKK